jgi:cytoskeletal protein RodZ
MTPSQKPEWIEIADKDNSAFPRKVSKGLPVIALAVTASIIGIGSIFAQTADESPASAVEISAPAVQSSQSAEPSPATEATQTFAVQTSNAPKQANTTNASFAPQGTAAASPSAPTMKNPSIGTLPTGGGDDDDDEGREHGDGGDDDEGDDD